MPTTRWDETDPSRDASGISRDGLGNHAVGIQQGYHYGSLTRGLVGYWRFDDDGTTGTAKDYATNYDGSITGAAYTTSSKIGNNALDFTAANRDYVDTGVHFPALIGAYTLTAWVYWDNANSAWKRVFSNHGANTTGMALGIDDTDSNWQFWQSGNKVQAGSPATGNWYFLAMVWTGSEVRAYVNNSLLGTVGQSAYDTNGQPFRIGDSAYHNEPWAGIIDDARLYNRPLSEPEMTALYNLTEPSNVTNEDTL